MAEVQVRPSGRGRGAGRGGRGGYSSRGGRSGNRQTHDKFEHAPPTSLEDQGEIGQLKKQYGSKVGTVKELFPDWTDEDIVFALQETDGDLEMTIERITEGAVSQWGEVKKKHSDRNRPKPKENTSLSNDPNTNTSRGDRTRGESGRGARGRGRSDRGRGAGRGGRAGSHANGNRSSIVDKGWAESTTNGTTTTTHTDTAWGDTITAPATAGTLEQADASPAAPDAAPVPVETTTVPDPAPAPAAPSEPAKSSVITDKKKTWASMFAKPAPVPIPKVQSKPVQEKHVAPKPPPEAHVVEESTDAGLPPPVEDHHETPIEADVVKEPTPEVLEPPAIVTPEAPSEPTPPKADLTETNLEQIPNTANPPPTATAASTVASTEDPHSALNSVHPSGAHAPLTGYATTALKATGVPPRSTSFQRRVLEQQEAVVMPGNHAIDTTVQFGSLGLGSSDDLDVDDDREEAETRAQPPQHSPVAPRASLPPAPLQAIPQQPADDILPAPRQAPGLPPAPQESIAPESTPQPPVAPQSMQQQQAGQPQPYNQFGRFGPQPGQEAPASAHKAYEIFGQPTSQPQVPNQYEGYPTTTQAPSQPQQQTSQIGGFSTATSDYSSYYTADQQRNTYPGFYGTYGQQGQNPQESGPQRTGSAFATSTAAEVNAQYVTSQGQQPSRYGQIADAQNSGHNTPTPGLPGQQPTQPQQIPQGQAGAHPNYPYGHPYYQSPYYAAYMTQMQQQQFTRNSRGMWDDSRRYDDHYNSQYTYGNQGYGGPYAGKASMYAQPQHGYGMSPQTAYEHSASPATAGAFAGQGVPGREVSQGSIGGYGRASSTQPENPQLSASNASFGNMPDVFGRSPSSFGASQQHVTGAAGGEEPGKPGPYGAEVSKTGGPSPSLAQAGRPGSAANGLPGQGSLPPPSQPTGQAFGGYPNHLNQMHGNQGSQYGLGGIGGHHQGAAAGQAGQGSGYGSYGAGFGSYGSYGGRGGWGANYGH
ncbi:MAG: RNAPII degradation factor [Cirrosporium novae-zelandiae]|nr:MAG: RNAPII degradation factor [Cirrosporium novae-zelandiae]